MKTQGPTLCYETAAQEAGYHKIVGIDEVGRGPFAGPVVASAVRLDPKRIPEGLRDSKKLTARRRETLFERIQSDGDIGIGIVEVAEIDAMNILQATYLAMRRAVMDLRARPDYALVDGNRLPPDLGCDAECLVKGDDRSVSIAAASIIAKVTRDRIMTELAQQFPGYGWERNAGYGTLEHREALLTLGVTPHHRVSFKPIHNILYQQN